MQKMLANISLRTLTSLSPKASKTCPNDKKSLLLIKIATNQRLLHKQNYEKNQIICLLHLKITLEKFSNMSWKRVSGLG